MIATCGRPAMKTCSPCGKLYLYQLSANKLAVIYSESEFSGAAVQRITNNEGMTLTSEPISKQEILRQAHLRRQVDSLQKKKLRAEEEVAKQE